MSSHEDPRPTKEALRADLRGRLSSLPPDHASDAAARATERFLALPEVVEARGILACLSFGGEIDTWPLVQRLQTPSRRVLVPRADPADRQLHVHAYPCELRELSFGLRQPPRGTPEVAEDTVDETVDVVLVLGLGFDARSYRLGYGTGYFDRFLARRDLLTIGLAYEAQIVDEIPNEAYDVPMSVVVTEDAVRRRKRRIQ